MSIFSLGLISFFLSFETPVLFSSENVQYSNDMSETISQYSLLKKKAEYNTWANLQIANWLKQADSIQWNKNIESSFSTLELTIRHLWNAEFAWLTSLKNETWRSAIEAESAMAMGEILQEFITTSTEFERFVQSMEDNDFLDTRKIGKDGTLISLADIIQHVFNHTTYHRGQLITMGRQAGLSTPPRTDYIYFLTK